MTYSKIDGMYRITQYYYFFPLSSILKKHEEEEGQKESKL